MSEGMVLVLFVLTTVGGCGFIALIFAVFIFLIFRGGRARNDAWADLAKRAGLTFKTGGLFSSPVVSGEYRGRPLRANIFSTGSSRHQQSLTGATVTLKRPADWKLHLAQRSGLADFLTGSSASTDIQVGNAQFDERFTIRSDQPERARQLLGRAGTQALIMAVPAALNIELEGQELRFRQSGGEDDPEALLRIFNLVSDLADAIEA